MNTQALKDHFTYLNLRYGVLPQLKVNMENMSNSKMTIRKRINKSGEQCTVVHYLLAVAYSHTEISDSQKDAIRSKLFSKCLDHGAMNMSHSDNCGSVFLIFDVYTTEQLNIPQLFRHKLRKLWTTVAGYVGINTVVVIIANN